MNHEMSNERTIVLKNDTKELDKLPGIIEEYAELNGLSGKQTFEMTLVLDELLSNIMNYAYEDTKDHDISLNFSRDAEGIQIVLQDDGFPFDPTQHGDPVIDSPLEERQIGGLGVFFVRQYMDRFEYSREGNLNVVRLCKKLPPPEG